MSDNILWTPKQAQIESSRIYKFAQNTKIHHACAPTDYAGLHKWSVEHPEEFWPELWDYVGIIGQKGQQAFLPGKDLRSARFFPDATLNYAQNLLKDPSDKTAIIAHRDDGTRRTLSRANLHNRVSQIVQALRAEGIQAGDRIAAIVTNDLEAIQFYIASAAIGAIWASCSPDFGPAGASDRLNQIRPKLLIAVPNYGYGPKRIDVTHTINAVAQTASVERIIILGDTPNGHGYAKPAIPLETWLKPHPPGEIDYHQSGFDTPMVILFSSGTTGKPKCIIHRAGGLLLQHLKEHALHCNIGEDDMLFYFSTCGWMMWNWQLSALALGATLVTFDGNPFFPNPDSLIDLIDGEKITHFGTSAKYIDALNKFEIKPKLTHDLSSLCAILSTGSPLLPASFDYVYKQIKTDVHLASISGGTDICACFVGGIPIWPVVRGELQGPMLGFDVDALDENANSISGAPGELVCRTAHPSMPLGFWDDEAGKRYKDAYFSQHENTWSQGDYIEKTAAGGFIIHGRSDATLNPGGVRIGTAEIYRQVETIDQVKEAVAVGQDVDGDQRIVLFIQLMGGAHLDEDLQKLIRSRIRAGATPRHVPAIIAAVPDIPRTRSGKVSEIAVRDVIHGRKVKNTTALANADCLDFYADWTKKNKVC